MAEIQTNARFKQTADFVIQEPSLRNTLSSFYDEIAPVTKLDRVGTVFIGLLSFGTSGLLSWFTVDFITKFGVSPEKIAGFYLMIHGIAFTIGLIGRIAVYIIQSCILPKSKTKLINRYIAYELEAATTPCRVIVGTESDLSVPVKL